MTRKTGNQNAGNATVAAVQQTHTANIQAAKNVIAPKQQTASKPSTPASKPATPAPKSNTAYSFVAAPKPATPQGQKVQAAPQKVQAAPQQQKAQAAPIKPPQFRAAPKKYDMGPGYEGFFQAALFQEPASWTRNQSPCHAPHRAAPKQLNKQPSFKAATPISKPSTPAPKAQANNNLKGNKAAPVSATKNKNAIKWNSPAGKQLILRPKNELVIYTPLWIQVYHWAQFRGQKQQRGRSADKTNKAQRLQQQKQRIAAQRKPNDRQQSPAPKQLSRQASAVQPKSPATVSRQASSIQSKSPAPLSRQQSALQQKNKPASPIKKKGNSSPVDYSSNTWEQYYTPKLVAKSSYPVYEQAPAPKAAPNKNIKLAPGKSLKSKIPPPQEAKSPEIFSFVKSPSASAAHSRATSAQSNRNAAPLKKQPSASSPVSGPDFFAQYLDRSASPAPSKPTSRQASAKPLTPSQQYAALRATKPKPAPYMNLKAPMPREMLHPGSEGANILAIKLNNDAEQRGIQLAPKPKHQKNAHARNYSAKSNVKSKPSTPAKKKPVTKQNSGVNSWFTPSGLAVASAIVAIGGVGISKLMN